MHLARDEFQRRIPRPLRREPNDLAFVQHVQFQIWVTVEIGLVEKRNEVLGRLAAIRMRLAWRIAQLEHRLGHGLARIIRRHPDVLRAGRACGGQDRCEGEKSKSHNASLAEIGWEKVGAEVRLAQNG